MDASIYNNDDAISEEAQEWEEDDEEEDDEYDLEVYGIHQALPMPEGEPNWDLPEADTVEEYLRRVRWEAARVPKVITSQINASSYISQQTSYIPNVEPIPPPPSWAELDHQWLSSFVTEFQQLRQYLAQQSEYQEYHKTVSVPHPHDHQAWDRLCFGHQAVAASAATEAPPASRADVPPSVLIPETNGSSKSASDMDLGTSAATETAAARALAVPLSPLMSGANVSGDSATAMDVVVSAATDSADVSRPDVPSAVGTDGSSDLGTAMDATGPLLAPECSGSSSAADVGGPELVKGAVTNTVVEGSSGSRGAATAKLQHSALGDAGDPGGSAVALEPAEFTMPGPVMSTVTAMDQVAVVSILQRHINQLERTPITLLRTQWLFALTGRVDKPLHADTAASLQQLLRRCCVLRSALKEAEDPTLPLLNIMIAISGAYFGQDEQLTKLVNRDLM